MKITKSQLKQIIKEEVEKEVEKQSDDRQLKPEEGIDAADHAIEIVDALKDLIRDMLEEQER
jgi:energy-coupling factor transporter ATP-binding protein EcfA2